MARTRTKVQPAGVVRETKGGTNIDLLRFPHEASKIRCPRRRLPPVTDTIADWWKSEVEQGNLGV